MDMEGANRYIFVPLSQFYTGLNSGTILHFFAILLAIWLLAITVGLIELDISFVSSIPSILENLMAFL